MKFHHEIKKFYYKNLFRKIYTVVIIGLIGANVFSMFKGVSFADESVYTMNTYSTDLDCGSSGFKGVNGECVYDGLYYGGKLRLADWVEFAGSDDDIVSVVLSGETVLNLKNDPVEYGDGINTCGEGFHILNSDDINLMFENLDAVYVERMIGEAQDTTQQEPEG